MSNFVDNTVTEVGSSSGAERMTRSRARRNREERAARCEANTLARRTARASQPEPRRESRHPRVEHRGDEDRSSQPEPGRESRHPPCQHRGNSRCSTFINSFPTTINTHSVFVSNINSNNHSHPYNMVHFYTHFFLNLLSIAMLAQSL